MKTVRIRLDDWIINDVLEPRLWWLENFTRGRINNFTVACSALVISAGAWFLLEQHLSMHVADVVVIHLLTTLVAILCLIKLSKNAHRTAHGFARNQWRKDQNVQKARLTCVAFALLTAVAGELRETTAFLSFGIFLYCGSCYPYRPR